MKERIQGSLEGEIGKVRNEVLLTTGKVKGKMGEGNNEVKGENE